MVVVAVVPCMVSTHASPKLCALWSHLVLRQGPLLSAEQACLDPTICDFHYEYRLLLETLVTSWIANYHDSHVVLMVTYLGWKRWY